MSGEPKLRIPIRQTITMFDPLKHELTLDNFLTKYHWGNQKKAIDELEIDPFKTTLLENIGMPEKVTDTVTIDKKIGDYSFDIKFTKRSPSPSYKDYLDALLVYVRVKVTESEKGRKPWHIRTLRDGTKVYLLNDVIESIEDLEKETQEKSQKPRVVITPKDEVDAPKKIDLDMNNLNSQLNSENALRYLQAVQFISQADKNLKNYWVFAGARAKSEAKKLIGSLAVTKANVVEYLTQKNPAIIVEQEFEGERVVAIYRVSQVTKINWSGIYKQLTNKEDGDIASARKVLEESGFRDKALKEELIDESFLNDLEPKIERGKQYISAKGIEKRLFRYANSPKYNKGKKLSTVIPDIRIK